MIDPSADPLAAPRKSGRFAPGVPDPLSVSADPPLNLAPPVEGSTPMEAAAVTSAVDGSTTAARPFVWPPPPTMPAIALARPPRKPPATRPTLPALLSLRAAGFAPRPIDACLPENSSLPSGMATLDDRRATKKSRWAVVIVPASGETAGERWAVRESAPLPLPRTP